MRLIERFWPLPKRPKGFNDRELWSDLIENERGHRRFILGQFAIAGGIIFANVVFVAAIALFA